MFSPAYLRAFDADMQARARAIRDREPPRDLVRGMPWDICHVAVHGQSLAEGGISHPNKTLGTHAVNLMIGDSVRPVGYGPTFDPFGGTAVFKPLVSTVDDPSTGTLFDESGIEGLSDTAGVEGESPGIGYANTLSALLGTSNAFCVTSTAKGGTNIATLTDVNGDHYKRFKHAMQRVKALADAESKTSGLHTVYWDQGQADYSPVVSTVAAYVASFDAFLANLWSDAQAIFGQTVKPIVLISTTGDKWANDYTGYDGYGLTVARAHLELARKHSNVFVVGPTYHRVNKPGQHLCGNGSRWTGCDAAKVAHRIINQRQGHWPLDMVEAVAKGNHVLVGFHTPVPPIRFKAVWDEYAPRWLPQRGMRVTDASGDNPVVGVEIVGQSTLLLTLARDCGASTKVWCGDKTVNGGLSNICDSDDFQHSYTYDYNASRGDMTASNVAELVGKPYPAENFAVGNCIDAPAYVEPQALGAGAAYFNYLGGSALETRRNLVSATMPGVIVGNPSIAANFARFTAGQRYLELPYIESPEWTLLIAARGQEVSYDLNADKPVFASAYGVMAEVDPPRTGGALLYIYSSSYVRGQADDTTALRYRVAQPTSGVNAWGLFSLRAGADLTLKNHTDGATQAALSFTPPRLSSKLKWRIGSDYTGAFGGTCDVAFVGLWSRKLSDTELNAVVTEVDAALAARSITV